MRPIHLDIVTVVKNARLAYEAGELQAQGPNVPEKCTYEGPCAIGVSMTPKERIFADRYEYAKGTAISILVREGKVVMDPASVNLAQQLQADHDHWVSCKDSLDEITAEAQFVNNLFNAEKEYGLR